MDSLPQQICEECVMKINDYMDFRAKCHRTYNILINAVINRYNNISANDKQKERTKYSKSPIRNHDFNNGTDIPVNIELNYENDRKLNNGAAEYEMSVEDALKNSYEFNLGNISGFEKVDLIYDETKSKTGTAKDRLGAEGFPCKFCHEKFNSKISMYNHYKTHTGKTVVCEHCGAKFSTKRRLLVHCRAKHGYEKIDKCSFCDYTATNAESVKVHVRTHTGEKPFVCTQCGAAFHRRSCYLQHIPIHLSQKTIQDTRGTI